MSLLALCVILTSAAAAPLQTAPTNDLQIASGRFKPDMDSLKQYRCPKWFRDAKFGIWAHWGPQSVPMEGDWYARQIYQQGSKDYNYHLEHYGHPSVFGYKDIIPLWKAEKWDPDRLMRLYKRAGAKYFVSMGSHHDNFFLWKSKLHRWNAYDMGPHRDVVGEWQRAARKYGLKFGVSEHLGASFTWFQVAHGSDKTGPKAGVPYDGADPKYWDLYHFPAEPGDTGWYSNNPKWQHEWFADIKELVDNYHPDLLYTDGGVPFGNVVGLSMIAHLYNSSAEAHGGTPEVVYTCKQKSEGRWVEDLERGIMPRIDPDPWQTDTSIGDWFYNRDWKFRPVSWVIDMLVDNVSKNGNLLLNVVQRPDGSLDPEVERMLEQMADWNSVFGEAIFGTRPWLVYGESSVRVRGGSFGEDYKYNAHEIRFTTKGRTLYAIALGWPDDGKLVVRSLAEGAGKIRSVSLLGYGGKVAWQQTPEGLVVTLPQQKISEFTCAVRITGSNLKPVPIPKTVPDIRPDAQGAYTLNADDADLHGSLQVEQRGSRPNIGFWDNAGDWASWSVKSIKPGTYNVTARCAALADTDFVVEAAGAELSGHAGATGSWESYKDAHLGELEITSSGPVTISIRPKDSASWHAMNLQAIRLVPATGPSQ